MRSLRRPEHRWALMLAAVALAVLAVSFVAVCVHVGTLAPWTRIVHENGRLTLLETIFYFEHSVRELPLDIVLGLGLGGSFAFFFPRTGATRSASLRGWAAALLALTVGTMLVGSVVDVGSGATLENLLQEPIRDGVAEPGGHWRYHLLSRLALLLLGFAATGVIAARSGRSPGRTGSPAPFVGALALFAGLSLAFGLNLDPLRDPRFLGHQARELFTHTLVTLPVTLALLLAWTTPREALAPGGSPPRIHRAALPSGALSVLLGAGLAAGVLVTGATDQSQSSSLARTVAAHFFEHSGGYLLVPLTALVAYAWSRPAQEPPADAPQPLPRRRASR